MKLRLSSLGNTVLLAAIAATSVYWALQWSAARSTQEPVVAVPTGNRVARTVPVDMAPVAGLFGANQAAAPARVKLVGIISEGGKGSGVALLGIDAQPISAFRAGEPIDANLVLEAVNRDRVVLRSGSGTQEVRLPERPAPSGIEPAR